MGYPAKTPQRHSLEEYFRIAQTSEEKLEFHEGRILAMAGGTGSHSLITANAIREIGNLLKGSSCHVYDSNLRVRISRTVRYVYPDATVICGPIAYDPADAGKHTATNPRLIVEVLSDSTEGYDRGDKLRRYFQIPSLQEYVLISQKVPVIEVYARQADGSWSFRYADGPEASIRLQSIDVTLPLAEVFAGVEFPKAEDEPTDQPASE